MGFGGGADFWGDLCNNDTCDDDYDTNRLCPGERFLSDEDGGDKRKYGNCVGENACCGGSQTFYTYVIAYIGQSAAEDTQND